MALFQTLVPFLEHRVLALERLELLDLARPPRFDRAALWPALEDAITHFLAPPRQHEGVDVEGVGDRLHLHPGHAAKLHRRELELHTVTVDLLRTGSAH